MEMTKLTLSAPVEVVDMAKRQARRRGVSVSSMFASYIRMNEEERSKRKTGRLTDSLLGVVRLPDGFDYRAAKDEYFGSRYGIRA